LSFREVLPTGDQGVGEPGDRGEGRPELVTHHGDEVVLDRVGLLGCPFRFAHPQAGTDCEPACSRHRGDTDGENGHVEPLRHACPRLLSERPFDWVPGGYLSLSAISRRIVVVRSPLRRPRLPMLDTTLAS